MWPSGVGVVFCLEMKRTTSGLTEPNLPNPTSLPHKLLLIRRESHLGIYQRSDVICGALSVVVKTTFNIFWTMVILHNCGLRQRACDEVLLKLDCIQGSKPMKSVQTCLILF